MGHNNNPVAYVSWYDAARFTNWLTNGQVGSGTEAGAYTLLGGTPEPSNGNTVVRNAGATWWLPSRDEWYKAAYHKNDGVTANYWKYATASNSLPSSDQPPGSDAPLATNVVNFFKDDKQPNGYNDGFAATGATILDFSQNYLTDVGAYTLALSPYGTYDQSGNVGEWCDTRVGTTGRASKADHGMATITHCLPRNPELRLRGLSFPRTAFAWRHSPYQNRQRANLCCFRFCGSPHSPPQIRPPQFRLTSADGSD